MKCITLTQAAETDGGERVLREMGVVPGPGFHFGAVIKEGAQVKSWVHIPGEDQLFFVTETPAMIKAKVDATD